MEESTPVIVNLLSAAICLTLLSVYLAQQKQGSVDILTGSGLVAAFALTLTTIIIIHYRCVKKSEIVVLCRHETSHHNTPSENHHDRQDINSNNQNIMPIVPSRKCTNIGAYEMTHRHLNDIFHNQEIHDTSRTTSDVGYFNRPSGTRDAGPLLFGKFATNPWG